MSSTSVECQTKSRELGHQETLFLTLNQFQSPIGVYANVNIIEAKHEIALEQVKAAFEEASRMNYLMRACVSTDGTGISLFTPINEERLMSDWTFVDEMELSREEDWVEILPQLLERKIDFQHGPLWYVKWIKVTPDVPDIDREGGSLDDEDKFRYILVFVSSHVMIDGKCGFHLIRNQIIPILNGKRFKEPKTIYHIMPLIDAGEAEVSKDNEPIYFAKSMEQVVYNFDQNQRLLSQRSVPFFLRAVTNGMMLKHRLGSGCTKIFGGSGGGSPSIEDTSDKPPQNEFKAVSINRSTTSKLIKVCKSRNVSVHSLLMVLVHNALDQTRRKFQVPLASNVLLYPIDARKFNPALSSPSRMPLGDYHKMGQQEMKFASVDDEDLIWRVAAEAKRGVQEHNQPMQEKTLFDCLFHLLQKRNLSLDTFNALPPPCVFSNLGNSDAIKDQNYKKMKDGSRGKENADDVALKSHFFTLQTGSGVFISANTYLGQMHLVASYGRMLAGDPGNFIAKTLRRNIETVVEKYS
jgi:hypothetical protein